MNTTGVSSPTQSPYAATSSERTGSSGGIDTMFMQLLMTQLKNQDPLSPQDPSAFVQQLAQVTSLDQLTQINSLLQKTLGGDSSQTQNSRG